MDLEGWDKGLSAVVLSKRLDSWALSLICIVNKVEVCGMSRYGS